MHGADSSEVRLCFAETDNQRLSEIRSEKPSPNGQNDIPS